MRLSASDYDGWDWMFFRNIHLSRILCSGKPSYAISFLPLIALHVTDVPPNLLAKLHSAPLFRDLNIAPDLVPTVEPYPICDNPFANTIGRYWLCDGSNSDVQALAQVIGRIVSQGFHRVRCNNCRALTH